MAIISLIFPLCIWKPVEQVLLDFFFIACDLCIIRSSAGLWKPFLDKYLAFKVKSKYNISQTNFYFTEFPTLSSSWTHRRLAYSFTILKINLF